MGGVVRRGHRGRLRAGHEHVPSPTSSRRAALTTGCGQDQTRNNMASRTARSAKWPETKPAPLEAARSACVERRANEFA